MKELITEIKCLGVKNLWSAPTSPTFPNTFSVSIIFSDWLTSTGPHDLAAKTGWLVSGLVDAATNCQPIHALAMGSTGFSGRSHDGVATSWPNWNSIHNEGVLFGEEIASKKIWASCRASVQYPALAVKPSQSHDQLRYRTCWWNVNNHPSVLTIINNDFDPHPYDHIKRITGW